MNRARVRLDYAAALLITWGGNPGCWVYRLQALALVLMVEEKRVDVEVEVKTRVLGGYSGGLEFIIGYKLSCIPPSLDLDC